MTESHTSAPVPHASPSDRDSSSSSSDSSSHPLISPSRDHNVAASHHQSVKRTPSAKKSPSPHGHSPHASAKNKRTRQLVQQGWLSDQHGAWPIAIVPIVLGIIVGAILFNGPISRLGLIIPTVILVIVGWMSAFLDFSALTAWLKSHRRPRYHRAIVTYTLISALCAFAIVLLAPRSIVWLIWFIPFFAITTALTWTGHERDMTTRVFSIISSLLVLPTLTDIVSGRAFDGQTSILHIAHWQASDWNLAHAFLWDHPFVWIFAGGLGAYYIASVPYVKTMIRQRKSLPWLIFSILIHFVFFAITIWLFIIGQSSFLMVIMWLVLLGRSIVLPSILRWGKRRIHPRFVGKFEAILSIFIVIGLLLSIPSQL